MTEAVRLVSFLLPTRGRVDKLQDSLRSLESTAWMPSEMEVLVKVDDDDARTREVLRTAQFKFHIAVVEGPRGNGYADLHLMYNRLCEDAKGRFLFLWNDDATMLTQHWDQQLTQHDDGRLCYVKSRISDSRGRDQWLFPIVHRSYYDTLGHFSLSAHNDTYVYSVFNNQRQAFRDTDILIRHNALENLQQNDVTAVEAKAWWPTTKELWGSPEVQKGLAIDQTKISELLAKQLNDAGVG